jgi:DNA (cytosine-5)-methyltransferase 1
METSKTSTGETLFDLTSYVADTLANRLASLDAEQERMTHVIFGHGYSMPLANYDPNTQSWKMLGVISLWEEQASLQTLPPSGMTQNGILYQLHQLVRLTDVTALSLLPTPTTQEVEHPNAELTASGRRKSKNKTTSHSVGLADLVQMWPTMTANGMGSTGHRKLLDKHVSSGQITQDEKRQMSAGNGGRLNPTWVEWLMGFPLGWTDLEDSGTP